ncbi:MAG: hypothetical protein QOG76_5343, partial [Pseudonocardiales bacterium]|nr:hypothetical protein [Pseudonocardiales bacterium]
MLVRTGEVAPATTMLPANERRL